MVVTKAGWADSRARAFTVVELLASMAVILMVMLVLVGAVGQTSRIWTRSAAKISQYQAARAAFESLTRNLSQATLNTYYGVEYDTLGNPRGYYRESELHYVSGAAAQDKFLGKDESKYPTHAVFFQAPLGYTAKMDTGGPSSNRKLYGNLNNLISAAGYYIEWGEDTNVPEFLKGVDGAGPTQIAERNRFRLMEAIQPAESLGIYATTSYNSQSKFKKPTDWIQVALGKIAPPLGAAQPSSWVRAENIVALVLLPKIPERDRTPPGSSILDLAPEYEYDSRPLDKDGKPLRKESISTGNYEKPEHKKQFNQLPPTIQVVMVAIDETSAARQELLTGKTPPDWTKGLFQKCRSEEELLKDLGDPAKPSEDSLISRLAPATGANRMDYRVYTAEVMVRGSKWTTID